MLYQCKSYLPSGSLNIILAFKCLAHPITWDKNETEKILFRPSETVLRRCGGQPTVKCFKTGKSGRSRAGSSIFSNILRQRRRLNNEASGVTQISHKCSEKNGDKTRKKYFAKKYLQSGCYWFFTKTKRPLIARNFLLPPEINCGFPFVLHPHSVFAGEISSCSRREY